MKVQQSNFHCEISPQCLRVVNPLPVGFWQADGGSDTVALLLSYAVSLGFTYWCLR